MRILVDNKDLESYFSIKCIDYTDAFSFPAIREDEMTWEDKSGVDRNLANVRYDAKEFILSCVVKASTEAGAYNLIKTFLEYIDFKGCFVLSLRDEERSIRECFLCERSSTIVADINVRHQNSLYKFKLGLKDVNPNAVKYYNTITDNTTSILYTKGKTAVIYWGDGVNEEITNSGTYTKDDYVIESGEVDIIVDIDKDTTDIIPLIAEFSADVTSGYKELSVQFTDESTGDIAIWSWDFGDGSTSSEQNPPHTYLTKGNYTVILQVFNSVQGSDVETKANYITVLDNPLYVDDIETTLLFSDDEEDYILIN